MAKSRTGFQMGLDGELTKLFNSNQVFRDFLIVSVRDFTNKLAQENHVKFFVKGGTALKLLKLAGNIPDSPDWSDWDTQIIINPNLSTQDWYTVFRRVQKTIIKHILEMQVHWEALVVNNAIAPISFTANNIPYNNVPLGDQVNAINTLSTPVLHPLQTFDNANNVLATFPNDFDQTFELTQLSKKLIQIPNNEITNQDIAYIITNYFSHGALDAHTTGLLASQNDINNVPALMDQDAGSQQLTADQKLIIFENFKLFMAKYPGKTFTHSSFTANSLIEDFYLYRMVVRYELPYHYVNGTTSPDKDHKVTLRAELLDISIPRRDTAEAFHQYAQVNLLVVNLPQNYNGGIIWIPDWVYQVQENIILIVEVIEDRSGSPAKIDKRISRGFEALSQIDNAVINTTVQKLLGIAPNIYGPWLAGIQQNIGNNLPLVLILVWLLESLEEDFKLGKVITTTLLNQLTAQFNNLLPTVASDYTSVENTIPASVRGNLTQPFKDFIGTVQFSRRVSMMFAQAVDAQNLQSISEISTVLNQANIPNVMGPQISSLLVMQHLEYTPSPSSQQFIYPFFDIFVSPLSNDNQVAAFHAALTFLSQNGFTVVPSPGPPSNNSFYLLTKNGIHFRLSHHDTVTLTCQQILNGRSILRNNLIISELNLFIAISKNIHVVHWLDGLRKDFKKALTTF